MIMGRVHGVQNDIAVQNCLIRFFLLCCLCPLVTVSGAGGSMPLLMSFGVEDRILWLGFFCCGGAKRELRFDRAGYWPELIPVAVVCCMRWAMSIADQSCHTTSGY